MRGLFFKYTGEENDHLHRKISIGIIEDKIVGNIDCAFARWLVAFLVGFIAAIPNDGFRQFLCAKEVEIQRFGIMRVLVPGCAALFIGVMCLPECNSLVVGNGDQGVGGNRDEHKDDDQPNNG